MRIQTFRRVSEIAMATQVGQIAVATRFEKAITGAEQIAVVTPTTVRKRPCESVIRTQESDYTYIQYMVMSNRRIEETFTGIS